MTKIPHRPHITHIFATIIFLSLLAGSLSAKAQAIQTIQAIPPPIYFEQALEKRFANEAWSFEQFCPVSADIVARRILQSYGAMFVANSAVKLPSTCVFRGESDVRNYQKTLEQIPVDMGGVRVIMQRRAAAAIETAIGEASVESISITPLDGSIAGGRSYGDTLMVWNSRFFPAMEFWIKRGRLPETARDEVARLDLKKKVEKVLEWESQGIYFSTDRSRSILTSTAPPGTSQHLAMIALDVVEFRNPRVRALLNKNGWFQTVIDDPGHFTYLGYAETELPGHGLLAVAKGGHLYWVPNLMPRPGVSRADPTH